MSQFASEAASKEVTEAKKREWDEAGRILAKILEALQAQHPKTASSLLEPRVNSIRGFANVESVDASGNRTMSVTLSNMDDAHQVVQFRRLNIRVQESINGRVSVSTLGSQPRSQDCQYDNGVEICDDRR